METEDRILIEKNLKLSEENNKILRRLQRHARLDFFWSVIKILVVVVPLIIGYLYLEPYLGTIEESFNTIKSITGS